MSLLLVAFVSAAPAASAHSVDQSYLFLDVTERALVGRVELSHGDTREVLGLELDGTADENLAELEAGEVPREFDVTFDPFFDGIESRDALLIISELNASRLIIVAVVTLAAAAYQRFEAGRGRLLPVDDGGRSDGPPDGTTAPDAEPVPEAVG